MMYRNLKSVTYTATNYISQGTLTKSVKFLVPLFAIVVAVAMLLASRVKNEERPTLACAGHFKTMLTEIGRHLLNEGVWTKVWHHRPSHMEAHRLAS